MLKGDAVPPLKWGVADEDGLVKFLVEEKSFSEERIRKVVEKVNASRSKATQGATNPLACNALATPMAKASWLTYGPVVQGAWSPSLGR